MKFYLDGFEVVSPVNWEDISLSITRNRELDTLLFTADTTFEFSRNGAKYLKEAIDNAGFCDSVDFLIEDGTYTVFTGTIFLASCDINEGTGTVTCKVEDNSFYKLINSNKSIETVLSAGKSKDGTAITPAERCLINFHDHSTVSNVKELYTVRVFEAFRYLVDFMSNGQLSFASDTFDMGGDWEGLVITSGLKMRATINDDGTQTGYKWPNPALPPISFIDLYTEVKKKIPIGISIEGTTLRLEALDYYYDTSNGYIRFEDIETIRTTFDQERLYSAVEVGSEVTEPAGGFPETQNGIGFKREQFASDISCNIDKTLDLVSKYVISSNVIEDCITNNASAYDDDIFLVTCNLSSSTAGTTTRDDIFYLGFYFFNDDLRNPNVLLRYSGGVPSSLIQYNGTSDPSFEANASANVTRSRNVTGTGTTPSYADSGAINTSVLMFDTEVSDPNNVYATSAVIGSTRYHVFTAPEDALYGFEVLADFDSVVSETGSVTAGGAAWTFKLSGFISNEVLVGNVNWALYDLSNASVATGGQKVYSRDYYKFWSSVVPSGIGGFEAPEYFGNGTSMGVYRFSLFIPAGYKLVITPSSIASTWSATSASGAGFGSLQVNTQMRLLSGSYVKCYSSSLGDLNLPVTDINQYIARHHSFTVPLTQSEFEQLKSASRSTFEFAMNGQEFREGWIQDVKYNYVKGTANIKLISNTEL